MQLTAVESVNLLALAFIAGGVYVNYQYMRRKLESISQNMVTKKDVVIAIQEHELRCEAYTTTPQAKAQAVHA